MAAVKQTLKIGEIKADLKTYAVQLSTSTEQNVIVMYDSSSAVVFLTF